MLNVNFEIESLTNLYRNYLKMIEQFTYTEEVTYSNRQGTVGNWSLVLRVAAIIFFSQKFNFKFLCFPSVLQCEMRMKVKTTLTCRGAEGKPSISVGVL